jgi:hypothetical protein
VIAAAVGIHPWRHEELLASPVPGRDVSVATMMMHSKRPKLFPVLDALVVQSIGGKYYTGRFPTDGQIEALALLSTARRRYRVASSA